MERRLKKVLAYVLAAAIILAFVSSGVYPAGTYTVHAQEDDQSFSIEILSFTQSGNEGKTFKAKLRAYDFDGQAPESGEYRAYIYFASGSGSTVSTYSVINSSDGIVELSKGLSGTTGGKTYEVYARLYDFDSTTILAESAHRTITLVQPSINKNSVVVSPSKEDQSTGSITVSDYAYKYLGYYKSGSSNQTTVEGNTITGLSADSYYVFTPWYSEGDTYYLRSGNTSAKIEEVSLERYNVTLKNDGKAYFWEGNSKYITDKSFEKVEGETLTYKVIANDDYTSDNILDAVTLEPEDGAKLSITEIDDTEWDVKVTDITEDITLSVSGKAKPKVYYTVTAQDDEGVDWSKREFEVEEGQTSRTFTLYAKPSDSTRYYITGVAADPAGNADVTFHGSTGEVDVTNITGNVTLIAEVHEKALPTDIVIEDVDFKQGGNYSEENPAIQTIFKVKVLDQNGNVIPEATFYFKNDEKEVSPTYTRKTGLDGTVDVIYSYGIEEGEVTADFKALFAFDREFTDPVSEEVHLVLQQKKDLVLYTDQIVGTAPGASDGKVFGVPDNYELWTGDIHQGALVVGSGEWIRPTNGEFTGLSSNQHAIRFGEEINKETNTFYFASDYADFFVPRGVWEITVDEEQSEGVIFTGVTEQTAEPGGTVYIYVQPKEGHTILTEDITVNKPSYIGEVSYYESAGYIVIEGITGNITVTVKGTAAYEFIEGANEEWTHGSNKKLHTRINAPLTDFKAVYIDGKLLTEKDFSLSEGSTIIDFRPGLLDKLSDGEHHIEVIFTDGTADTDFEVVEVDKADKSDKSDKVVEAADNKPEAEKAEPSDVNINDEAEAETEVISRVTAAPEAEIRSAEIRSAEKTDAVRVSALKDNAPKTGDEGPFDIAIFIALISILGIISLTVYRRRFKSGL